MKPKEIKSVRKKLEMTQVQIALFVGVHPLTISKWERGVLTPSPYNDGLLRLFRHAQKNFKSVGKRAVSDYYRHGLNTGLSTLFSAANRNKK